MERLAYFEDRANGFLLAYERSTEFFVRFLPKTGEWEDCGISFMAFRHDHDFTEISREEALKKTDGRLPEAEFKQYLDLIARNSKG